MTLCCVGGDIREAQQRSEQGADEDNVSAGSDRGATDEQGLFDGQCPGDEQTAGRAGERARRTPRPPADSSGREVLAFRGHAAGGKEHAMGGESQAPGVQAQGVRGFQHPDETGARPGEEWRARACKFGITHD